jgi:ABC-type transporter MlaC component
MRWLSLLLSLGLAGPLLAAEVPPLRRTEEFLATLQLDDGRRQALARFVDREALVGAVVQPLRARFSATQYQRTRQVFWQLVQVLVCPELLTGAKWQLSGGEPRGDQATVHVVARKTGDDWQSDLTFRWQRASDGWRVVDVEFDGASLVADYRNQFARIVEREGAAALVRKLEQRQAEERRKRGGPAP